jgi:hypothetical protein
METPIPHGTIGGYTNHACRCDLCKQAQKDYRLRKRAEDPEGVKAKAREQMRRSREKRIQEDREAYLKKAAEQQAEWRKNNPERWKEIDRAGKEKEKALHPERVRARSQRNNREWKEKNPEGYEANRKRKFQYLRLRRYQLTADEYAALLESQGGVCAICGKVNGLTKHNGEHQLVIDHCHDTGAVRGLLCYNCNLGLGNFKDDLGLLIKAIAYLKRNCED